MDVAYIEKIEHKEISNALYRFTLALLDHGINELYLTSTVDFFYPDDSPLITIVGISDGRVIVIPNNLEEEELVDFEYFTSNELRTIYFEAKKSLCSETCLDLLVYNIRTDSVLGIVQGTYGVAENNIIKEKYEDELDAIEYMIKVLKKCQKS